MTATLDSLNHRANQPPILDNDAISIEWFWDNPTEVRELLDDRGVLVIRNLGLSNESALHDLAIELSTGLFEEKEAMTGRDRFANGVYSPSVWPPAQPMCMHHELSYRVQFPEVIAFSCIDPAATGGEIETADGAAMLDRLPAELIERIEREGWILARSYGDDIGLSLEEAFGTSNQADIEAYCAQNKIEFRWTATGGLQTRQRRPGVVYHPRTGQRIWFNQLAFLSEWTLDSAVRDFLIDEYGINGLPFNTFFGNGQPLSSDVVTEIQDAYTALTVSAPMQPGDLTLVDNVRTAHGRAPYTGDRFLMVALCGSVNLADLGPRPPG